MYRDYGIQQIWNFSQNICKKASKQAQCTKEMFDNTLYIEQLAYILEK